METHMKATAEHLFGEGGLQASNFKLFPGKNRDATPEQVAQEINASLAKIEAGDFDDITNAAD
jgi:hypothetical protein